MASNDMIIVYYLINGSIKFTFNQTFPEWFQQFISTFFNIALSLVMNQISTLFGLCRLPYRKPQSSVLIT